MILWERQKKNADIHFFAIIRIRTYNGSNNFRAWGGLSEYLFGELQIRTSEIGTINLTNGNPGPTHPPSSTGTLNLQKISAVNISNVLKKWKKQTIWTCDINKTIA